jgi:hypothetical protein
MAETPNQKFNRMIKGKENDPVNRFHAKTKSGKGFDASDFTDLTMNPNAPSNRRVLKQELKKDIAAGPLKKKAHDLIKALKEKGIKAFIEK